MFHRGKSSWSEMLPAFWAEKQQQLPKLDVPLQAVPECRQGADSAPRKIACCSESAEQRRGHTCHPALECGLLTHQLCISACSRQGAAVTQPHQKAQVM